MQRLFGKKRPVSNIEPPDLNKASDAIGTRVDAIDAKIKACDEDIARLRPQMSGPRAATVKSQIMTIMKRKKMYEQQLQQVQGTLFNVDQVSFATEQMKTTIMTVDAMKYANTQVRYNSHIVCL